ncbi:BREX-3 system P-loop-containing protein BrxF [Thiohalocapsa marina]|uniref:BREX-3 system P-loop-containing protein BrxF n=1 Tax=Thiohalocapsa marina TaxID=424902 RepID=UPI0036DF8B65
MLPRLKQLVDEIAPLHSKLILLIGSPGCGKTALLLEFAEQAHVSVMNLGLKLGARLARLPHKQRRLQAGHLLREIADEHASGDLLLVDNIELLFDASLAINPLDLLKRLAHARRVVAAWPGEHREGSTGARLIYAETSHPEHRDDSLAGVIPFFIQT